MSDDACLNAMFGSPTSTISVGQAAQEVLIVTPSLYLFLLDMFQAEVGELTAAVKETSPLPDTQVELYCVPDGTVLGPEGLDPVLNAPYSGFPPDFPGGTMLAFTLYAPDFLGGDTEAVTWDGQVDNSGVVAAGPLTFSDGGYPTYTLTSGDAFQRSVVGWPSFPVPWPDVTWAPMTFQGWTEDRLKAAYDQCQIIGPPAPPWEESQYLDKASLSDLPGALTPKFDRAWALGPIEANDASTDGSLAWVWRAEIRNDSEIWIARENNTRDGWREATLLVDTGETVDEVDLTFDQNGQPCAAYAAGGRIKLYWFDPVEASYVMADLDSGRNPGVILDTFEPVAGGSTDMLLFYAQGGDIIYRQQRDRFTVVLQTPVVDIEDVALIEVGQTRDYRIRLTTAQRQGDRWELVLYDTAEYPHYYPGRAQAVPPVMTDGELRLVVVRHSARDENVGARAPVLIRGGIEEPVVRAFADDELVAAGAPVLVEGGLQEAVIRRFPDAENAEATAPVFVQGSYTLAVIRYFPETENTQAQAPVFISGGLEIP